MKIETVKVAENDIVSCITHKRNDDRGGRKEKKNEWKNRPKVS